ncbi:hypothetical protein DJ535_12165 [Citrobacter murliniae]|uniref:Uncharacterized protein n=1 Tax=Citrobacter murliniae TaxID=67829 RepID=A0ABY2PUK7_9ENTR|nr:hypothetical protein [Citrobacter murliniae]THE38459.1 hypothetical protein DJ535_12165 [Citrobacter murliniae]
MVTKNLLCNNKNKTPYWITVREAVKLANKSITANISECDIYRHALHGNIFLSIYFQSPILLRKIRKSDGKVILYQTDGSFINRLCQLERNCFLDGRNLVISTEGEYFKPENRIIDTTLAGYEYVLLQRLLARSLKIPLPVNGASDINYGISVSIAGEIYQIFEKIAWPIRIQHQIIRLLGNETFNINREFNFVKTSKHSHKGYFPLHNFPLDACFVIRNSEVEKLISMDFNSEPIPKASNRISTPLSRMFWLACKHNETISPLIKHPYKLISIFEQWASAEGITDRLSGDTLKTALERGSPSSSSP